MQYGSAEGSHRGLDNGTQGSAVLESCTTRRNLRRCSMLRTVKSPFQIKDEGRDDKFKK